MKQTLLLYKMQLDTGYKTALLICCRSDMVSRKTDYIIKHCTSNRCFQRCATCVCAVLFLSYLYVRYLCQSQKHMERYLLEEWQQVEKELLRERSLWGPAAGSRLQRWMLDMTEGWFKSLQTKAGSSVFMLYSPLSLRSRKC